MSPNAFPAVQALSPERQRARFATRDRLRAATREVHEKLHVAPLFDALAKERLDRAGYRDLLVRLWGFYRPLEVRLAERDHLSTGLGLNARDYARWPLLRADLIALGLSARDVDGLPKSSQLPSLESSGALLGVLYVVEGSALGGREIARGLDYLLPPDEIAGRRFFAGEQPRSALWRACCTAIERYASTEERLSEVVAAASDTFRLFEFWLNRGLAPR